MRDRYIEELMGVLDIEDERERCLAFKKKYLEFCKFCYENDLNSYDDSLFKKADKTFLLESSPLFFEIDSKELELAIKNLKRVQEEKRYGILDGITKEEAEVILKSVVNTARNSLKKNSTDFLQDSLAGSCGYAQALTGFLLEDLGLEVASTNAHNLPDSKVPHAFIICSFPIKDNSFCEEKRYLVDVTYRQFFVAIKATEASYYDGGYYKNLTGPVAGYYVMQSPGGEEFARSLLKNGYIELTEENARIYGSAFSKQGICLNSKKDEVLRLETHTGREYIEAMVNNKESYDYTREEMCGFGEEISLIEVDKGVKNK